MIEIIDRIFFN